MPQLLNRDAPESLQDQLVARLRADLQGMAEGARLPTETDLTSSYGVSRTTVRGALQVLVDEGRLIRRQGMGTFVARPRLAHPLDEVWAFVETFTARGLVPQADVLTFGWTDQEQLPAELGPADRGALLVRRLYRVDDDPMALAEAYLPPPFGLSVSRADVEEHPTYQILQDKLSVSIHHARVTVRSRAADADVAGMLDLTPGAPLLALHRWLLTEDEHLLQYALYHLPADKFEFNLESHLNHPHPVSHQFNPGWPALTVAVAQPQD